MAKRHVRASGKNTQGDITKRCHSGESWSPRSKGRLHRRHRWRNARVLGELGKLA